MAKIPYQGTASPQPNLKALADDDNLHLPRLNDGQDSIWKVSLYIERT
jgi:hypothetical protein